MTVDERFWSKVAGGDVESCWEWTASKNGKGYGTFYIGTHEGKRRFVQAHRWAYGSIRSDIPMGLHLDHLCHNRACVNPWHLEPVTNYENHQRRPSLTQDVCSRGHAYTAENTITLKTSGRRRCRACARQRYRDWGHRNKIKSNPNPA